MLLTPKFEINQKVWFIVEENQYAHGRVTDIVISINSDRETEIIYTIKHGYSKKHSDWVYLGRYSRSWNDDSTIDLEEDKVFEKKEYAIDKIQVVHINKIYDIKEYRK